jgi:glyoxylase-like metal-dependent hydrolase (beta-lactamase superfamily II)
LTETDTKGRILSEIKQSQFTVKIGNFYGFDFFGDGSFYLLDVPGHAVGQICGLARTTGNTFMFMGADTCHHPGQYRPSEYVPLPEEILPNPYDPESQQGCPCSVFENIHPYAEDFRTRSFYDIKINPDGSSVAANVEQAHESIRHLQEFDAADNVFIICAHDSSLFGVVEFFPKYANHWKDGDWKMKGRWKFLAEWASVSSCE